MVSMYQQRGFGFSYHLTPVVKRLLIANAAVFVVTLIVGQNLVFDWFAFQPHRVLQRFWGVFTYMFVHAGFWHLFVNMLVLFFFGPPLEARWGAKEFFRFYVIAGLGGVALGFVLAPGVGMVVGASAAIYGVMLAFAMNWPDAPIYVWGIFPVKAKWLVTIFFLLTLFGTIDGAGGQVAHFAHLGGLLTAFAYLKLDWRGSRALGRLTHSGRGAPRRLAIVPRDLRKESGQRSAAGGGRSAATGAVERRMLDEVDRVLDKISAHGMASLTEGERKLLDEVSRRQRSN